MKLTSTGIIDGMIQDLYGKRGLLDDQGNTVCSPPLEISDAPAGTVSFALICEDKDAIPVCGFSYLHWVAANITKTSLPQDDSRTATDYVQGKNSGAHRKPGGPEAPHNNRYAGMAPPNCPHTYEFHLYALDTLLDLQDGFWANELYAKMQGHILATDTLKGQYQNEL